MSHGHRKVQIPLRQSPRRVRSDEKGPGREVKRVLKTSALPRKSIKRRENFHREQNDLRSLKGFQFSLPGRKLRGSLCETRWIGLAKTYAVRTCKKVGKFHRGEKRED